MSYYTIKNGQAQTVEQPENVSGYDLILAQMSIADRQAQGIYSKLCHSAGVSEAVADPTLDTIFAPMPPEPPTEPKTYDRIKLIDALAKRNLLQVFDAFMANDPSARWYFTTATVIEESHPVFVSAMGALVNLANVPQSEVDAILKEAQA